MKKLLGLLLGTLLPATAGAQPLSDAVLERLSIVHAVQIESAAESDQVILFSLQDTMAKGNLVALDGTEDCQAGWSAQVETGAEGLLFTDIDLQLQPCADEALLQDFANRLARVHDAVETDEGIALRDAAGQNLMYLVVGG